VTEQASAAQFARHDLAARLADEERLAPAATRSAVSKGRARPEEPDAWRTPFQVDRDRILHSKAFRRLKHKTQVFLGGQGAATSDHVVTRLTHALQVTQVARALAQGLGLNEPLAEAIALGHDVGHSPFGHTGEEVLDAFAPDGWHHAAQSVRIYQTLEDRNLTWEVRDGIRAHSWRIEPGPATPEGQCVRFADRIAYLSHDTLDAVRARVLQPGELPAEVRLAFGEPGGRWVGIMVEAVLDHSNRTGVLAVPPEVAAVMAHLREFLFARVYRSPQTAGDQAAAARIVRQLVEYHLEHPESIPRTYHDTLADPVTQTLDFVAGMTDRYAVTLHQRLTDKANSGHAGAAG
jgi:dGTPase